MEKDTKIYQHKYKKIKICYKNIQKYISINIKKLKFVIKISFGEIFLMFI